MGLLFLMFLFLDVLEFSFFYYCLSFSLSGFITFFLGSFSVLLFASFMVGLLVVCMPVSWCLHGFTAFFWGGCWFHGGCLESFSAGFMLFQWFHGVCFLGCFTGLYFLFMVFEELFETSF